MLTEKLFIVYECGWILPYLLTYICGVTSLLRICEVSPCVRACMLRAPFVGTYGNLWDLMETCGNL